jgi:hypothetical protein
MAGGFDRRKALHWNVAPVLRKAMDRIAGTAC